jgi:hypothetical protein
MRARGNGQVAIPNGHPVGLLNPFKPAEVLLAYGSREQFAHQYPATAT